MKLIDRAWAPNIGNNESFYKRDSIPETLRTDANGYFPGAITIPTAFGLYGIHSTVKWHVYDHAELYFFTENNEQLQVSSTVKLQPNTSDHYLFYILGY